METIVSELKENIENVLTSVLPETFNIIVKPYRNNITKTYSIKIMFSPNNYEINKVNEQYPQCVSLILNTKTLELKPQVCGNGGQYIYLTPDKNDEKEKYLTMKNVKIPFRTPKPSKSTVLSTIKKFAENYLFFLKEYQYRLYYTDIIDYTFLNNISYSFLNKKVVVLDNNGETLDRYTIIDLKTSNIYGCSENPFQEIGQYSHTICNVKKPSQALIKSQINDFLKNCDNIGKKINVNSLPQSVINYILYLIH